MEEAGGLEEVLWWWRRAFWTFLSFLLFFWVLAERVKKVRIGSIAFLKLFILCSESSWTGSRKSGVNWCLCF